MNLRRDIVIFFLIVAAALAGCSEDSVGPIDDRPYFPDEIGYSWTYAIYDSLTHDVDTATVSIVDIVPSTWADTVFTVLWESSFRVTGLVDTQFIVMDADTSVRFSTLSGPFSLVMTYRIPLVVGDGWNIAGADSVTVDRQETISVPALGSVITTVVHRSRQQFNHETDFWFVPKRGIVQIVMQYHVPEIVTANRVWTLIEFSSP